MIRLINDAGILEEEITSLDGITFDQMIEAIHVVQTELNITGTTANEASGTIQGSISALSASWQNLLTGLGDADADLSTLIDNVVQNALNVVNNIKPVAQQAISGVSTLITELAPVISEELPPMLESILPSLVSAIASIVDSVASVIPSLLPSVLPSVISAVTSVVMSLLQALPAILSVLKQQLPVILSQVIPAILLIAPELLSTAIEILGIFGSALADNVDLLMDGIMSIIHFLVDELLTPDNIEQFTLVALDIILTIAESLIANIPEILGAVVVLMANVLVALAEALPDIAFLIIDFIVQLGEDFGNQAYEVFGDSFYQLLVGVGEWLGNIASVVGNFVADIIEFFVNLGTNVVNKVSEMWSNVTSFFSDGFEALKKNVTDSLDAVKKTFTDIFDNVKDVVFNAIEYVKGLFDFEWKLPDLKLPHFKVSGEFNLDPTNFSVPSISVDWYAKAMNQPYLLDDATIFGASGGKLLGGGETGGEIIYGQAQLMADIGAVIDAKLNNMEFVVPVYIGGKKIDQQIVVANARNNVISGGR